MKNNLPSKNHYVIGIGASAGGLEALHDFFDSLPPRTNLSFVVIQHLSPDYKSLLRELLSRHTHMDVVEVENNMQIKPDTVYVIPIKKFVEVNKNRLVLTDKIPSKEPNKAIDIFFSSLANEWKDRAIAVILSGTGSDGVEGIKDIKDHGGYVIVQEPVSAKFDGMPNSAIRSGYADVVTTTELMYQEVETYILQPEFSKSVEPDLLQKDEMLLNRIISIIKKTEGLDFNFYKRPTIIRRITRRMFLNKIESPLKYLELLNTNKEEISSLAKDFLIGVTKFFRDKEPFEILQNKVIPTIFKEKENTGEPIKVWVAGVCTGEEAYSIAMLFHEYLQSVKSDIEVKIFATDIDKESISIASKGIYKKKDVQEIIPHSRIEKYFIKKDSDYQVIPAIRKMVIFAIHDITQDPPFSKMDLVTCRNLLIYLNPVLQKKVLKHLHFALNLNGFLLLGTSESLGQTELFFEEVDRRWKIYKNIEKARMQGKMFSMTDTSLNQSGSKKSEKPSSGQLVQFLEDVASDNFGYAGVFISEDLNLVEAFGKYKNYISFPEKEFVLNISKLVVPEISTALGPALLNMFRTQERLKLRPILLNEEPKRIINIEVVPYNKNGRKLALIFFSDEKVKNHKEQQNQHGRPSENENLKIGDLENELYETRQHLQLAIEEVESSNEELQSTNEELISSNEELQSTNEELQSLNEELNTVNTEHQLKIKQLEELNDDLQNYFRTSETGQIFIGNDLVVLKYTPAASKIVHLIESDIGRPITHIANNIKYENLLQDIKTVITEGNKIEKEVELYNADWYQMSIVPYIRNDKSHNGVVISFYSITQIKRLNQFIFNVINSSLNGIMTFKAIRDKAGKIKDFEWLLVNKEAEKITGLPAEKLLGNNLLKVMPGNKKDGLFRQYCNVVETGKHFYGEHRYDHENINKWFDVVAIKTDDGFTVTFADITERKESSEKLRNAYHELQVKEKELVKINNHLEEIVEQRTRELNKVLKSISEERERFYNVFMQAPALVCTLKGPDFVYELVNPQYQKMFGDRELLNKPIREALPELVDQPVMKIVEEVYRTGKPYIGKEEKVALSKNINAPIETFYFNFIYQPIFDQNNHVEAILVFAYEVTDQVKSRSELSRKNVQLTRVNNDLDNFIYTASHDLKAPIANVEALVSTLTEVMVDNQFINDDTEVLTEMIRTSINKFKETIKDLTEISKLQKQNEEEVEEIDCSKIIEDVKIDLRKNIVESNAIIVTDTSECHNFYFSKKNFKSIITNLLSNALKYRSPGRQPYISIKAKSVDGYTIFCIEDNGIGLDKGSQSKMFQMFKRFHSHVEGSGIGLYIVKKIIDNSGGKIEVESEVGKGTKISVYFCDYVKSGKLSQ